MDRVNLFNPFDSQPSEHEDPLTWAFLVTLKYNPPLQNFLRELVQSRLPSKYRNFSNIWEPANIFTQTQRIEIASKPELIVSVLLTDEHIENEIKVDWSKRQNDNPRYDGVMEYQNGLILIIENKPRNDEVWEEQLSPSLRSFPDDFNAEDVENLLHDSAVCLKWPAVLEGVLAYINSKSTPFEGREVAGDFLTFVEENHSRLTPYRTFKLCGGRHEALKKRTALLCRNIARDAGLETDQWGRSIIRPPNQIAKFVCFDFEAETLRVFIWPANTIRQAKDFLKNVNKENFLAMGENWNITPDFHFAFMGTNLANANTKLMPDDYLRYFLRGGSMLNYGQYDADDTLKPIMDKWQNDDLIDAVDIATICDKFINTNRQRINVIPGFEICREWNLGTVNELERQGELQAQIRDAINDALRTWGEKL